MYIPSSTASSSAAGLMSAGEYNTLLTLRDAFRGNYAGKSPNLNELWRLIRSDGMDPWSTCQAALEGGKYNLAQYIPSATDTSAAIACNLAGGDTNAYIWIYNANTATYGSMKCSGRSQSSNITWNVNGSAYCLIAPKIL